MYVGKWSTNDAGFMSTHHMIAAYPWVKITNSQYKWEVQWHKSLCNTGFKNDEYIQDIRSLPIEEVAEKIKRSINSNKTKFRIDNVDYSVFDSLKILWGRGDLEVVEALCILLAAKLPAGCLNTQIDFLPHRQRFLTGDDIEKYLSPQSLKNRYATVQEGWFSIGFRNLKNLSKSDFKKDFYKLNKALVEKVIGKSVKAIYMNRDDVRKVLEAITVAVTSKTIKHMCDTIKRIQEQIPGESGKTIRYKLEEFKKTLQSYEGQKKGNLYKAFFECLDKGKDELADMNLQDHIQEKDALEHLSQILIEWVREHRLSNFLRGGKVYDKHKELDNKYKKDMTDWIQTNVFKPHFVRDKVYTQKQVNKYKNSNHQKLGHIWLPPTGEPYTVSLIRASEKYLPESLFFVNSWFNGRKGQSSMYGEQVSIWLGTEDPFCFWHTIKAFENQPPSETQLDYSTVF